MEGFKVLGVQWCLRGGTKLEFERRLASAWRRFHQLWPMLGYRKCSVPKRLKLLDSCVAGVLLWANNSWTLTQSEKKRIRTTQTAMVRKIVAVRRKPDEEYVSWMKRATNRARQEAADAGVADWQKQHLMAKWRWAGHVARMPGDRWALKISSWRSEYKGDKSWNRPLRFRPGAFARWEKDLDRFCASGGCENWWEKASNKLEWKVLESDFVVFCKV